MSQFSHCQQLIDNNLLDGSERYYATLYLDERSKSIALVSQFFIDELFGLLLASKSIEVRQQKISWWQSEWQNILLNNNARHPVSLALLELNPDETIRKTVADILNSIAYASQAQQMDDELKSRFVALETQLLNLAESTQNPALNQQAAKALQEFELLKNLHKNWQNEFYLVDDLPKYLDLGSNQQQIIDQYVLNKLEAIESQMPSYKDHQLFSFYRFRLVLLQKQIKKLKKNPQKLYNSRPILNPLQQFFSVWFAR